MSDGLTTLHEEHLLLGASMECLEGTDLLVPMGYPFENTDSSEAHLCDLTGLPYALLSGLDSQALAEMSCAGKPLRVGECAFEAVFFGDGRLIGIPLVMRTGEHEYCLIDLAASNDACMEWILGLSRLRQGDAPVFGDVTLEDASDMLVPLMLTGPKAATMLSDYLAADVGLPPQGELISCTLDRIQALVAGVPDIDDTFIVFVPPAYARVLWRSFLSFPYVAPMGFAALRSQLRAKLPWHSLLDVEYVLRASVYAAHGLIRADGQFVGMRGLLEG